MSGATGHDGSGSPAPGALRTWTFLGPDGCPCARRLTERYPAWLRGTSTNAR